MIGAMQQKNSTLRPLWWLVPLAFLLACATGQSGSLSPRESGAVTEARPPHSDEGAELEPADVRAQVLLVGGPQNPGAPPSMLGARPLTMARLRQLAWSLGIGVSGAAVTRNREVGRALQLAVGRCLNVPENFERFPTAARSQYSSVVPDGLLLAGRFQLLGGVSFNPQGAFLEVVDPDFLEVKGRQGPLMLSTAHSQILGLIDALALLRRPSTSIMGSQPRPALLLVTTADTKVDKAVVWEAAKRNVALFQALVLETEGWLSVGPFQQLTRFADAPTLFQLASKPRLLEPERR